MRVYLDDERRTPEGWKRTYTVAETILWLKTGLVEELSLDHDLGVVYEDGYDVLKWIEYELIVNGRKPPAKITVHSANPPARERMEAAIAAIERRMRR